MNYIIAISEKNNDQLCNHLIRKDQQEDLCFALYNISTGTDRTSGIIKEMIFPIEGDRNIHGNVSFNSQYFDRVSSLALNRKCGICFIHSHPSNGWQGMSKDDVEAENMLASRVKALTGLPLIGMTLSQDKIWSARFWIKQAPKSYSKFYCSNVRVSGKGLSISYNDKLNPKPLFGEEFLRTISSWGEESQAKMSRLKIGIVGLGSVGSIIAEALMRTGIQNISLIDFDNIERKNLDRLQGIGPESIGKLKVNEIKKYLERISCQKDVKINAIPYSIAEEIGLKAALDCDLIFSCVDRPWPRYILNCISYSNLLPIIDGGIDAEINKKLTNLNQARWKAHTIGPERACLKCLGQYKPEDVSLEMSGLLEDQQYIKGLPKEHFINRSENVFGFSIGLAAMEIHQFLSLNLQSKGQYYGPKEYDFNSGNIDFDFPFSCVEDCDFTQMLGNGDKTTISLITNHPVAEKSRLASINETTKTLKAAWWKKFFTILKINT